jgi:hypothetical protein
MTGETEHGQQHRRYAYPVAFDVAVDGERRPRDPECEKDEEVEADVAQ